MNKRSGNIFVIVGILAVLAFLLLHFLAHWSQAWLVFPVFALVGGAWSISQENPDGPALLPYAGMA